MKVDATGFGMMVDVPERSIPMDSKSAIAAAVEILAGLIDRDMPDEAVDSILHAIFFLRTGKYPFNRYPFKPKRYNKNRRRLFGPLAGL